MTKLEMVRNRVWAGHEIFRCDQCGCETESPVGWAVIKTESERGHITSAISTRLLPGVKLDGEIYLCCSRPCEVEMHYRVTRSMGFNVRRGRILTSQSGKLLDMAQQFFREVFHEQKGKAKEARPAGNFVARNFATPRPAEEEEEEDEDGTDCPRKAAGSITQAVARAAKAGA
jgi:hypothetical protein